MYTTLSRIILIAYQASLLSGIKSKISKLAQKNGKKRKGKRTITAHVLGSCFWIYIAYKNL